MGRVYLKKNFHYESMLGTTFNKLGQYLDACCLINAYTDDGCPVSPQCRDWWDNQCKAAYSDLPPSEIEAIIAEFDQARQGWRRRSLCS
jgi:hypothetical protein